MAILTVLQFIVNITIVLFLLSMLIIGVLLLFKDKRQKQHSVLRNYPLLARVRYFVEKIGPELRQYLFLADTEGKPFSRNDFINIVIAGKYNTRMTSFGTQQKYEDGFYIQNTMFPLQTTELHIDQSPMISTFVYHIDNERLLDREEHRNKTEIDPYYLSDEDAIILGNDLKYPFKLKRLVGQSGMSYGALGSHAITALSKGLGRAGTWMNTGEGGLSKYHLSNRPRLLWSKK